MIEFRSETLDLSPETLERLNHLKTLKARSTDLFLEESEAVLELNKRPDVQQNGGIGAVVSSVLGYAKGYTSKRLTVGERLIAPLGLERLQSAGFSDQEVIYQAARAVEKGMAPEEAVQTFVGATREAAVMLNRGEDELIYIPIKLPKIVVQLVLEGRAVANGHGFTDAVLFERYGVFLREASLETLETFSNNMEVVA